MCKCFHTLRRDEDGLQVSIETLNIYFKTNTVSNNKKNVLIDCGK